MASSDSQKQDSDGSLLPDPDRQLPDSTNNTVSDTPSVRSDCSTCTAGSDRSVPSTSSSVESRTADKQKKKRKHQSDSESSSITSEEIPKMRRVLSSSESRSSMCSNQRDSPLTAQDFPPSNTDMWDADLLLHKFRIHVRTDSDFFENIAQNMLDEEEIYAYKQFKSEKKDMIDSLEYIIKSQLKMINVNSVKRADLYGQIKDVETVLQAKIDELSVTARVDTPESKDFSFRAVIFGKKFVKVLKRMAAVDFEELSGEMYEKLFTEFLEMFSFELTGPSFIKPAYLTLTFSETDSCVTSKPDILIGFTGPDYEDFGKKLVAVCKVKKDCCRVEREFQPRSKASARLELKEDTENHISSKLLGQHCGDLLVHLPDSVFRGKGILGMIVQATEVSITALIPEEDYMIHLRDGFKKELKEAKLYISEPYNFLTREGRLKLCKFLIELFCIHNIFMEKQKQT